MHTHRYTCIHTCIHMHTQVHIQHLYVASAVLDTEDVRENEMETLWAHTQASRAGPNSVTLHRTGHPPPTSAHFSAHEQGPASGVKKQLLPALAGEENSLVTRSMITKVHLCVFSFWKPAAIGHVTVPLHSPLSRGPYPRAGYTDMKSQFGSPSPWHLLQPSFSRTGQSQG